MASSRATGEEAPLLPPGAPRRDYQGDQQLEDTPKKEDSPLLPMLEGRKAALSEERSTPSPFSCSVNADPSTAISFGLTRPASDAVSVTSFGGDLTTSLPNEGDFQSLQDVLDSLEKASTLVRKYMHKEELATR